MVVNIVSEKSTTSKTLNKEMEQEIALLRQGSHLVDGMSHFK